MPEQLSDPAATLLGMTQQHSAGTFAVVGFEPVEVAVADPVTTALPTGIAVLTKTFDGGIEGRAVTYFVGGHDQAAGVGTYVAFEAFDGRLDGRAGTFNFIHAASTHGSDRYNETFSIVDGSGTGELAGIAGVGGMAVDEDGTHRMWFDYELA